MASFDVLMDLGMDNEDDKETGLIILTYINCSFSILGILVTIVVLMSFKALKRKLVHKVLCHHLLSLLLGFVVFLAGIQQTNSPNACFIISIVLHYLLKTFFLWTITEAILSYVNYIKFRSMFVTHFLLKSAVCCWGFPFLGTIVIVSINPDLYRKRNNFCWPIHETYHFDFLYPLGLVMLINTLVFAMVIYSLFRGGPKALRTNQSTTQWVTKRLRVMINVFFRLGLPWCFGFFTFGQARLFFRYLFTILATITGFAIFLLNVIFKPSVRDVWQNYICGKKEDSIKISTVNGKSATIRVVNNFPPS